MGASGVASSFKCESLIKKKMIYHLHCLNKNKLYSNKKINAFFDELMRKLCF